MRSVYEHDLSTAEIDGWIRQLRDALDWFAKPSRSIDRQGNEHYCEQVCVYLVELRGKASATQQARIDALLLGLQPRPRQHNATMDRVSAFALH